MQTKSIAHYCQKCLAANPLGQELCTRCGTRLMLVVEPPAARFEASGGVLSHEEPLLERVSALENMLLRVTERMERTLDLLLQQARHTRTEHALVKSLVEILSETGTLDVNVLDARWINRCRQYEAESEEPNRFRKLHAEILDAYQGSDRKLFAECVERGVTHLIKNETVQGVRELERAAALAFDNAPLHSYLGEHFFREGKQTLARDYLQKAFDVTASHESRVCLLLGIACADVGEVGKAAELLSVYLKHESSSFAAHYTLGKIFAAQERWPQALAEVKKALAARPSPEANYVIGCLYYQLKRDRLAARHLRKALSMDERYAAASYALGLVILRDGDQLAAREALAHACAVQPSDLLYRAALASLSKSKKRNTPVLSLQPLFGGGGKTAKKGIVTGGDARLSKFVREAALEDTAAKPDRSQD
ncbi:MAG: tetratricopeptide repeat protein [Pyrinomonadaceae bacterium]